MRYMETMISFIDEKAFSQALKGVVWPAYLNPLVLGDPEVGPSLKRYALLHLFPERFDSASDLDIYYNKYYWFLRFSVAYSSIYGYDPGIAQQEFRTVEQASTYPFLNWKVLEEIELTVKGAA